MTKTKRNSMPRKSSPDGIKARMERREKTHKDLIPKQSASGSFKARKPGSRNPRKVGR